MGCAHDVFGPALSRRMRGRSLARMQGSSGQFSEPGLRTRARAGRRVKAAATAVAVIAMPANASEARNGMFTSSRQPNDSPMAAPDTRMAWADSLTARSMAQPASCPRASSSTPHARRRRRASSPLRGPARSSRPRSAKKRSPSSRDRAGTAPLRPPSLRLRPVVAATAAATGARNATSRMISVIGTPMRSAVSRSLADCRSRSKYIGARSGDPRLRSPPAIRQLPHCGANLARQHLRHRSTARRVEPKHRGAPCAGRARASRPVPVVQYDCTAPPPVDAPSSALGQPVDPLAERRIVHRPSARS